MAKDAGPATLTWLGHGTLYLTSAQGTTVLIDPWLKENPATPEEWRSVDEVNAILVTHGHFDHITDVAATAMDTGATVIGTTEVVAFLAAQGVTSLVEMNKGGSIELEELKVTMVPADHSSGCPGGEGKPNFEGGSAVGFVIRSPDLVPVYIAGDTAVFGDMGLIAHLYQPGLAVLPIGDHFTMGPFEAAYACELLGVPRVLPYHWGTFPILVGRPDTLADEVKRRGLKCEVLDVGPGQSVRLNKRRVGRAEIE